MKNEIRKTSIPFDINPKHIYNEISEEIGLICPENNHKIYLFYKAITNFPFINPEYIFDIYNYIKIICQIYNYFHFLNFLEYFNKTYLYKYDIQYWNYYNDINHIINNASESFNNYLKQLFYKKPSFYELIYHLKREESLSYYNYKRKIEGESELIDKKCDKNDIIDLWYKCLLELNKI
ncbi:hypothetical protein U3516DRAFT_847860 [Neocallimastix sp. 'constans']